MLRCELFYSFPVLSFFEGLAHQTIAVATTPPATRSIVRNINVGIVETPVKFILNNPNPREIPIEIQIDAVEIALGHSFISISWVLGRPHDTGESVR